MRLTKTALWIAAGCLLFAGAAAAQPLNISNSPGVPSVSPRVATDSLGNAHAVWVDQTWTDQYGRVFGDVWYAMGDIVNLQLNPPVKLSTSNTVHCETYEMASIAVDASNRVYVLWVESLKVVLRIKDGGVWGAPITILSGYVCDSPRIAVTPGGDIYTIFWNNEGHAFSVCRVGGVWEELREVGYWDRRTKMADIAIGNSIVGAAFAEKQPGDYYNTGYAQRNRAFNSTWTSSTLVGPSGHNQQHPALRVDSSDVAHVVWTTLSSDESTRVVHYSRKSGSGFTSPVEISSWEMLHYPFMNIANGVLYVAWQVGGYGNGSSVDYNIRDASGVWQGVQAVPNSSGCTFVDIAPTPDGGIVYWVWDKLFGQPSGEIFGWAQSFAPPNPLITLGTNQLFFGAIAGGAVTPAQTVSVVNSGAAPQSWAVTDNQSWLSVTPGSGAGSGRISVTVNPSGLSAGTYSGLISVSDPDAPEYLPKTITVTLHVYAAGTSSGPIGAFDTPIGGTTVRSSIAVTGWALDDVAIKSVKIYRDPIGGEPAGPVFVGDAVLVEGARPDVALAFPYMPQKGKAGWGYMLLTNFLPNGGNGAVTLRVRAEDYEGHITVLDGPVTVNCANASAVLPFGAIDTPIQGGMASGSAYTNFGWALTPQPCTIPTDGSTINVWVDGVPLGHPVYNYYRADIAGAFPGYTNSNGAVGVFTLDTTGYANGVHTIAWSVADDAGHMDGIGSRFFEIYNEAGSASGSSAAAALTALAGEESPDSAEDRRLPLYFRKGWDAHSPLEMAVPENDGRFLLTVRETERVEIQLNPDTAGLEIESTRASRGFRGFLSAGPEILPLPIGSTLNRETGVFSWSPGPGFIGDYRFVFLDAAHGLKRVVVVRIVPKY